MERTSCSYRKAEGFLQPFSIAAGAARETLPCEKRALALHRR